MALTDSFLTTTDQAGKSTTLLSRAGLVNVVRGLHKILLATLGGVPHTEVTELKNKKEQCEKAFEAVVEILHTPFLLTDLETKKKEVVAYREMLNIVCTVIEHDKDATVLQRYKWEKLDSQAAEVLYGYRPRPKKSKP